MAERKVALVTGGSRGIGRAISLDLARNGYAIAINFHSNIEHANQTRDEILQTGGTAEIVQADVADIDQHANLAEFPIKTFGRIDFLVNNAGIAPEIRRDILETDLDSFRIVLETNLTGPYFLTQRIAKHMIALRQSGRIASAAIVNISSIRAYTSAWNYGEYCISKAGLSMVTRLFAHRLAEYGINVYEIRPGVIETDMTASESVRAYYNKLIGHGMAPIDRWGRPDEVARAVGMLARGDLPFSTGEVINVDGGWHLRQL